MGIKPYRIRYLADRYQTKLQHIHTLTGRRLRLLDLGCGSRELTGHIVKINRQLVERMTGMDIYALQDSDTAPMDYLRWDGHTIPLPDDSMDAVIVSDLVHHVYPQRQQLFREAARVAEWMLIKDHFEYGPLSRLLLRGFDVLGNWRNARYGANVIPQRYFDTGTFAALCAETGYQVVSMEIGHNVYGERFRWLFPPRYQFIALLRRG